MKPKYSGDKSQKFWDKVNSLKNRHGELYSLGVCLQNFEGFVLKQLKIALLEQGAKNTEQQVQVDPTDSVT